MNVWYLSFIIWVRDPVNESFQYIVGVNIHIKRMKESWKEKK